MSHGKVNRKARAYRFSVILPGRKLVEGSSRTWCSVSRAAVTYLRRISNVLPEPTRTPRIESRKKAMLRNNSSLRGGAMFTSLKGYFVILEMKQPKINSNSVWGYHSMMVTHRLGTTQTPWPTNPVKADPRGLR
jgi:hypothetical protein